MDGKVCEHKSRQTFKVNSGRPGLSVRWWWSDHDLHLPPPHTSTLQVKKTTLTSGEKKPVPWKLPAFFLPFLSPSWGGPPPPPPSSVLPPPCSSLHSCSISRWISDLKHHSSFCPPSFQLIFYDFHLQQITVSPSHRLIFLLCTICSTLYTRRIFGPFFFSCQISIFGMENRLVPLHVFVCLLLDDSPGGHSQMWSAV